MEAALSLAGYYADMIAAAAGDAGPTTSPRPCSTPRSTATGSPTTRSSASCSSWSWPATRPPPSCSANAWYWALAQPRRAGQALRRPGPRPGLGRGDAALRHVEPDARPGHHHATSSCTARPSPPATGCCCSSARPTATSGSSPTPTATTSAATPAAASRASASAATSAWAPRWPGSRPASRSRSWSPRVADYDVDPAGIERVHSVNVRGFAALPTTVDAPLMPRFEPHPDRRPAAVTGASSGIGAATATAPGRGRPPRRARRPPRRAAARSWPPSSAPTAARPPPWPST